MREVAAPKLVLIALDVQTSECVLTRSDGMEARFNIRPDVGPTALAKIFTTPNFGVLLAITKAGETIVFELPTLGKADRRDDRAVVYLDQNHWSAVANAVHGTGRVADRERSAALQLAEWSRQRKILLPASAGHYTETTSTYDAGKRYRLGLTILQLSRGWYMRDPLQVRREELRSSLLQHAGATDSSGPRPVFSLDPDTLYAARGPANGYESSGGLPPKAEFSLRALSNASANISTILDDDRIPRGPEGGWVKLNQDFSDWLDGTGRERQQKRNCIDAFLISDLSREIPEVGAEARVSVDQMSEWATRQFGKRAAALPALGLFRELLHDRHLNIGTRWTRNDLTDMIYLSCAAGYADFVVCERHMRNGLAQGVSRLGRPVQVFRRLADLLEPLEARLGDQAKQASVASAVGE